MNESANPMQTMKMWKKRLENEITKSIEEFQRDSGARVEEIRCESKLTSGLEELTRIIVVDITVEDI